MLSNLFKSKKKKKITAFEIGLMLKTVSMDNPDVDNPEKLAELISEEFNVICKKEDVIGYHALHVATSKVEDYELESRKAKHGYNIGERIP